MTQLVFNEIMIDLETLGTKPGSAIVSIGACAWSQDHDEIGPTFYTNVNAKSCQQAGLTLDAETVLFWMKQNEQARAALTTGSALPLAVALEQLTAFVVSVRQALPGRKDLGIWGNDNTFDIVLTEAAYDTVDKVYPWNFWESRSVRTHVAHGRRLGFDPKKDMPREGTYHNALDDAIHQAKYCRAISRLLFPKATAKAA
tara:strand:+ start:779 stop:1378 length:600 start_codon:yes stop_codon:yes gene_type:complete